MNRNARLATALGAALAAGISALVLPPLIYGDGTVTRNTDPTRDLTPAEIRIAARKITMIGDVAGKEFETDFDRHYMNDPWGYGRIISGNTSTANHNLVISHFVALKLMDYDQSVLVAAIKKNVPDVPDFQQRIALIRGRNEEDTTQKLRYVAAHVEDFQRNIAENTFTAKQYEDVYKAFDELIAERARFHREIKEIWQIHEDLIYSNGKYHFDPLHIDERFIEYAPADLRPLLKEVNSLE